MYREKRVFGACQRYIEELSCRVVAESGRACDRYHLGKLILQGLKDAPEFTLQIDGSTGESESFASVLERSVQCAHAFKELGLKAGDVIVMMTPNDLNLSIPYYAGLYLGVVVSPIDRLLKITTDFNPEESTAVLMPTSGTTGLPKQACLTYKNFVINAAQTWCRETTFPTPFKAVLIVSPMQWLSCVWNLNLAPVFRYTIVMSATDIDKDHFYDLVNKYKPNNTLISPTKLATLIGPGTKDKCDMSCFEVLFCGGSAVSRELLNNVQELAPHAEIYGGYGLTEAGGNVFMWGSTVHESIGVPALHLEYRLIDVDTQEDIFERNKPGELWIKGPSVCKGYYKNEEATKIAFSEDGWFKTGDLMYRDEFNNFYFVDRMKLLFKYMNHQISPVEIQQVIQQHPAVQDVAVTSIADQRGDLPVACVVLKPGAASVSAQEIKDLVKDSLTDTKQLRGGVVFMDKLPMTPSTKIDYQRLKKLVLELNRE